MKRAILLSLPLLSLAWGCKDEPTFEERYDAAERKIRVTAEEIDRDLEVTDGTASEDSAH